MQDSGTLPLIAESILSVGVGNVVVRQTRPSKGSGGGESQVREQCCIFWKTNHIQFKTVRLFFLSMFILSSLSPYIFALCLTER